MDCPKMRTRNINHFLIIFIWTLLPIAGQPYSRLESQLQEDMQDHVLHDFSLIQASLILSGVSEKDSLDHYMTWYTNLFETIQGFHFDSFESRIGSFRINSQHSPIHSMQIQLYSYRDSCQSHRRRKPQIQRVRWDRRNRFTGLRQQRR